jgi:hypothetical protein
VNALAPADWSTQALSARARIAEVFYRFAVTYDEAQIPQLVTCFTENASYEVAQSQAEPFVIFSGRADILANLPAVTRMQGDQRRHLISNVLVEELDLAAGTASAIAYAIVAVAANGLSVGASVIYSARLSREEDGCWRFTNLFIGMDSYAGERPLQQDGVSGVARSVPSAP